MADNEAATGPGGTPKQPAKGAPTGAPKQKPAAMPAAEDNSSPEDAFIVEETITKLHAPTPKAADSGMQVPPSRKASALPPPPPLKRPEPKPAPAPATTPAPAANPKPASAPQIPPTPPARPVPPPPPEAPAPAPVKKTPPTASAPDSMSPKGEEELKSNIAALLQDVKIPERRDPSESGEKKTYEVKQFDTALGTRSAEVESPPAKKQPAARAAYAADSVDAVTTMPHAEEGGAAPAQKSENDLVTVHTLKDDLRRVVHDDKVSYVRAVSLEEERRHRDKKDAPKTEGQAQRSKRVFTILFGIGVLVFLGASALLGIYAIQWARSSPPPTTASSILFSENSVFFPLDGQSPTSIKQTLAQARLSSNATLGSITRIIPTISAAADDLPAESSAQAGGINTQRPATFAEFMRAIGARPSEDLLRALSGDFFFGIHTVDKNAPLIIVPVLSYQRAFAGMLAWEAALNSDLAPAFQPLTFQTTNETGGPALRTFGDFVMRNYDTRVLRDDSGQIQMYYSFPTQGILVIAESPHSFNEILGRLQAERRL
ncbi:MAG: hypothetical protein U1D26_00265 [Patescibacteria group bacterium]|nr:hypothetical protein [Patescibacteria group bacterium]